MTFIRIQKSSHRWRYAWLSLALVLEMSRKTRIRRLRCYATTIRVHIQSGGEAICEGSCYLINFETTAAKFHRFAGVARFAQ
jgi:hypothetical protein